MAYTSNTLTGPHFSNYEQNTALNTHRAVRNDIYPHGNLLTPATPDAYDLVQTSTNIFIEANGYTVGMIQSFTITENRQINKLQAIGWEGVVQAVPSNTNGGQLNVSRIALYGSNLWNALGLTVTGHAFNPLGSKVHDGAIPDTAISSSSWDINTHTAGVDAAGAGGTTTTDVSIAGNMVFKTLKDQRVPLEIKVKTRRTGETSDNSGTNGNDFYIDTYVDCWLSSYSSSYTTQNITVAEQATIQYADVY